MIRFNNLPSTVLKYKVKNFDDLNFRNISETYNECMRGRLEPTIIFVSQHIHDLFVELTNGLVNKGHLVNNKWIYFRGASIAISHELNRNQMFLLNLEAVSDERYNVLLEFDNNKL